jgi:hypothetical protein
VIALAFVGQASQLGDAFYLFALLLPPVFLLGVFSYLRLVQTAIEDMRTTSNLDQDAALRRLRPAFGLMLCR